MGRAGDRGLVQSVASADHHTPFHAQISQNLGQRLHQSRVVHAQKLHGGVCRICQGPQNVENASDADLTPHRRRILHGGVIGRGEEETHTGGLQHLLRLVRAEA